MTLIEFLYPLRKALRKEQALAVLYFIKEERHEEEVPTSDIRQALVDGGIPQARKMNISQALKAAAPYARRVGPYGVWAITKSGEDHVRDLLGLPEAPPQATHDVRDLESLAGKVGDTTVRDYIEEAIKCLRADARRAAVVFLWSGAVATIRDLVWTAVTNPATIDAALKNHNPKARDFKKKGDFDYVSDAPLLEITVDLAVFDRSEKKQLKQALDLRNDCGHPVKYRPGEKKVSSFIEDVVNIVFA